MIHSGSHTLGGMLELREPAETVLAAWLARQTFADEFAERDTRWWLETIACARGHQLAIWEDRRSSYAMVDDRAALIDALAASAVAGKVLLVHAENGHHVTAWTITGGAIDKQRSSVERPPRPAVAADVRAYLDAKAAEVEQRYANLGDGDQLREFLAEAPRRRCLLLTGGSLDLRGQLFEYIAARIGKPVRYVADLVALPIDAQTALVEELRETTEPIVVIGVAGDLNEAMNHGKLRVDLYYRIAAGLRWAVKDSDAELIRPRAPTR